MTEQRKIDDLINQYQSRISDLKKRLNKMSVLQDSYFYMIFNKRIKTYRKFIEELKELKNLFEL